MVRSVADVMVEPEPEDFYLLSGVEQDMRFSEWVNREKLPKNSGPTAEEVDYHIDRYMTCELVERKTIQYIGYKLTVEGYNALALRMFAQRGTIQELGAPLDVGKESDVFEVQSFKPLTLRFHHGGYTNFCEVCRERDYISESHHALRLYTARKAAEHEYEALETPFSEVSVPRPADHNRHTIIMAKFDGVEFAKVKLESEQMTGVLDLTLSGTADVHAAGYAHADMSGHNVAVGEHGATVFDQPQAVPTDHNNARELLTRDAKNIVGHFHRKYPGEMFDEVDIGALSDAITGNEFESVDEFVV